VIDASGIPLGTVTAPANHHDSPLLGETLDDAFGGLPEHSGVHLDRAYDSKVTREILERRSLVGVISKKGEPAPLKAGMRWVVERTNSWSNAHKKLLWCTARGVGKSIGFLGGLLGRGHHRQAARPRRLETLPLGRPTFQTTVTY